MRLESYDAFARIVCGIAAVRQSPYRRESGSHRRSLLSFQLGAPPRRQLRGALTTTQIDQRRRGELVATQPMPDQVPVRAIIEQGDGQDAGVNDEPFEPKRADRISQCQRAAC